VKIITHTHENVFTIINNTTSSSCGNVKHMSRTNTHEKLVQGAKETINKQKSRSSDNRNKSPKNKTPSPNLDRVSSSRSRPGSKNARKKTSDAAINFERQKTEIIDNVISKVVHLLMLCLVLLNFYSLINKFLF
jgi:hypothetical protein